MFLPDQRVWLPADDINMSIGQGFVSVTPLQLATAYSAIANGGRLCEPRIAEDVQTDSGKVVRQFRGHCTKLPYPETDLAYIRNALTGVTSQSGGTAYYAFQGFPFSKVTVAGKTGTAQTPTGSDHSWYASWAPASHPRVVIVVLIEHGGFGVEAAAPAARELYSAFFHLR
jgi:penicillin-binding protein 2